MLDLITQLTTHIADAFTASISFVQSPSKRIYWGFLLTSALFALGFSFFYRREKGVKGAFFDLINPKALFSRSSAVDVGLIITNQFLRIVLFAPIIGGQIAVALFFSKSMGSVFGDTPQFVIDPIHLMVLFTLCFFIIDDLARFLLHVLMHKVPFMWHFHQVHHNAPTLTPLTLYRFHPAETFFLTCRSVLTGGFVVGMFLYLFSGRISGWDILGVNAIGFVFSALGSNLRHSHIPMTFGVFDRWFISPAQHQLHHSKDHIDVNFGTYLAIWDRLLGSWVKGSPHQELEFGLADVSDNLDKPIQRANHLKM